MEVANFTEFRTGLKSYLDKVENNDETLFIKRRTGKGTVLISLDEYNSIMETMKLISEESKIIALRNAIQEGIDSGIAHDFDTKKHLRELKSRVKNNG